ncbi:MAG: hypothetical protein WBA48_03450 [Xanthobacteraceae bacterium]
MSDEEFTKLFIKIEAQRSAVQSFVHVLVQRLAKDCGLDAELLLEHLHILQSNLPGFEPSADSRQNEIAKEVLSAFGGLIQSVDDAIRALADE